MGKTRRGYFDYRVSLNKNASCFRLLTNDDTLQPYITEAGFRKTMQVSQDTIYMSLKYAINKIVQLLNLSKYNLIFVCFSLRIQ